MESTMSHGPFPVYPAAGSKKEEILAHLLAGKKLSAIWFVEQLNLFSGPSRVAEMRMAGWPIKTYKTPHPVRTREDMTVYYMDEHFRRWFDQQLKEVGTVDAVDPSLYPSNDGRGKHTVSVGFSDEAT
jgi:hypothetical protein